MDIRFHGKRALVTGAGKGIGRCIAKALSAGGAHVLALSRTEADLTSLKAEDARIETVLCDVADWEDTRQKIQALGDIHLLVNNAAVFSMQPAVDATPQEFDRLFNINVKAMMNIAQVVAKGMIERKEGGSIVMISSDSSIKATDDCMTYSGTKAALDMMMKCMAVEWGRHQIRVNSVQPTLVLTNMGMNALQGNTALGDEFTQRIPQRKLPKEEDVMHAVLYLLSDKADMINASSLLVDGGLVAT